MNIKSVPLESLHLDPSNVRTHDARNLDAISASLRRFGQAEPLVVQERTGRVIGGNGRLQAMKQLGWTDCEVVELDLDDLQATSLSIALNRTGELAGWDEPALAQLLEQLRKEDALDGVGYSEDDIDALIQQLRDQEDIDKDLVDDGPEEPPAVAMARTGDLWCLGEHRLLCGDSTNLRDVLRVMGSDKAALCATDPPYLVEYTGERPNDSGKDWSSTYREIDIEDADGFFRSTFRNVLEVLGPKGAIYAWHAHKRSGEIQRIWRDLGILDHQQIIWVKPTPVFGRVYWHFRHEPCVMGWRKGDKPEHDGVHEHDSVWECDWDGKARLVGSEHPCLHPDALVLTDAGWRAIKSINVGTNVFAADGQFHPVSNVSSHPYTSPDLFRIVANGSDAATLASDNHPFMVWRHDAAAWVRADQLRVGDLTMTPAHNTLFPAMALKCVDLDGTVFVQRRIEVIERVPYEGDVWNLSVEGCPSFQTSVGMSHNTSKPVELFTRPIKKHTKPGDVVFEPFSGSGSQLIAAERTGRRCRAIEISAPYVDVAIRRWEKATGQGATLDGDGRTFARVGAERGPA